MVLQVRRVRRGLAALILRAHSSTILGWGDVGPKRVLLAGSGRDKVFHGPKSHEDSDYDTHLVQKPRETGDI